MKLRASNEPSCTLVGTKSRRLPSEREWRWRRQNCWTQHDEQREGSIVVSATEKGRRNLQVNWFTEWWYELSWLCTLFSCQSILRIPDGHHSSATWITAFALFVPFWTANITSPTVSKPLYISSRYLISPEATLGGISAKNAALCFSSRRETMNPCILIDLLMSWKRFWNDQKISRQLYTREEIM